MTNKELIVKNVLFYIDWQLVYDFIFMNKINIMYDICDRYLASIYSLPFTQM